MRGWPSFSSSNKGPGSRERFRMPVIFSVKHAGKGHAKISRFALCGVFFGAFFAPSLDGRQARRTLFLRA